MDEVVAPLLQLYVINPGLAETVVDVLHTLSVSKVMILEVMELIVTFTVSLHILIPLLTVAIYEVVVVGETVMEGEVAPVDQEQLVCAKYDISETHLIDIPDLILL